ncbi:MAG: hypothetical protein ACKVS8_03610, partial [Phycisphaerales bacterium]
MQHLRALDTLYIDTREPDKEGNDVLRHLTGRKCRLGKLRAPTPIPLPVLLDCAIPVLFSRAVS